MTNKDVDIFLNTVGSHESNAKEDNSESYIDAEEDI